MGLLSKVTKSLFGDPTKGFDQGIAAQNKMYEQGRADLAPYRDFGGNYLANMRNLMSNPNSVQDTPGYKFRFDQGREALENSAIARGGLLSGNTMKAISDYGQNQASNEYNNEFARLMQLIGIGSGAAGSSASMAQNQGNSLANLYSQRGQAEAEMMQFPWKLGAMGVGSYVGAGGKFGG